MTEKQRPIDDLRVGLADAGRLIGKSIQHVRNLVRDGFIPDAAAGKYRAVDVASGALKAREAADRRASQSAASSRLLEARAAEIEVRTEARKKAHLQDAQAHAIAVMDELLGPLKPDCLAIPARVTKDLVLRARIEDELERAFDAAADRAKMMHSANGAEPTGRTSRREKTNAK
ncbi:hypothetical protein [Rhodopseudomonas palustris]|uniref:Uncharacterized protein n=1 Tax=Rhodopseudomonas palustris TaxID=1076 RepID=A0A418V185_RHOPL|nr:hypothetical protein [Rhodopseudomonas palustris]RJF69592.1 hypothetical protein D4Q52_19750 [Rhodopseudomonas palustris]